MLIEYLEGRRKRAREFKILLNGQSRMSREGEVLFTFSKNKFIMTFFMQNSVINPISFEVTEYGQKSNFGPLNRLKTGENTLPSERVDDAIIVALHKYIFHSFHHPKP